MLIRNTEIHVSSQSSFTSKETQTTKVKCPPQRAKNVCRQFYNTNSYSLIHHHSVTSITVTDSVITAECTSATK